MINLPVQHMTIPTFFGVVNSKNEEKLSKLFNTTYSITKEELSLGKFKSICDLHTVNVNEPGNTCMNDPIIQILLTAFQKIMRMNLFGCILS